MKLPFVSRAAHEAVLADRERIRGERDQFAKDRDTQRAVARKATEQYAALDERYTDTVIVNECLTRDLTEERQVSGSLARQIHTMAQPIEPDETAVDWQAKYEAEKKRADQLQQQFDELFGLNEPAVVAGETWQERREQKMRYDK